MGPLICSLPTWTGGGNRPLIEAPVALCCLLPPVLSLSKVSVSIPSWHLVLFQSGQSESLLSRD